MSVIHLARAEVREVPSGDGWLASPERQEQPPPRFGKRRSDWRLGRWTAHRALQGFLEVEEVARGQGEPYVQAGEDGAPRVRWTGGTGPRLVVSLSHSHGAGFAAVGPGPELALGVDLERVEPRSAAFIRDYLTPAEQATIAAAPEDHVRVLANLAWSGKESVLKALREGLRMDPATVEVDLEGPARALADAGSGVSEVPWQGLSVVRANGGSLHGWWRLEDGFVWTIACDASVQLREEAPVARGA